MTKAFNLKARYVMRALFCAVSITALSGCASLNLSSWTDLTSPDVDAELSRYGPPSQWSFGPGLDQEIVQDWDVIIQDERLIGLIAEALENNLSLRASAENITRAEAILTQSRSALLPSLDFSVGGDVSAPLDGFDLSDRYSSGFSSSWEADLWGAIDQDIAAANFDLAGTRAFYESARQSLVAQVALAYLAMAEAWLQQELSQQNLDAQKETLRIVNLRYEFGAANRSEVVLSESDLASAQDTLLVDEADLRNTVRSFQVLLGRYPDGNFDFPRTFSSIMTSVYAGQPADILRRRPDILQAEYDMLASFADLNVQEADRWPRLILSSDFSAGSLDLSDIVDPSDYVFSLGARLADSLFDGGLTRGRIEAAESSARQSVIDYGQAVLDAYIEIEGLLDDLQVVDQRYGLVETAALAARETLRLSEIQYKEGAIDLLDVLTFRQRSFQSDRTLISIQRQQLEARIALYLALGGGRPREVLTVNNP